jgi:hypothetical protein
MVIVVVGAMIYMFQTFGGTGDKIEGVAQKTSVMTEINNIRGDLIVAIKTGELKAGVTLKDLANLGYFSKQINEQLKDNKTAASTNFATGEVNTYSAISFGGKTNPGMNISLILNGAGSVPGLRVELLNGLATNAAFLEGQISSDLASQASTDRTTTDGSPVALADGEVPKANRPATVLDTTGAAGTVKSDAASLGDGIFTIYFKDLGTVL